MKLEIEPDTEKALVKLTWREMAGIKIMLVIFQMIYPNKNNWRFKEVVEEIFKDRP